MTKKSTWSAASVKARLLNISRKQNEEFQHTIERYALERFLVRLGKSRYRNRFILKGAKLYTVWTEQPHRPTKDLDLLGEFEQRLDVILEVLKEICTTTDPKDGLRFEPDSIQVSDIREGQSYGGVRAYITAYLGKASCRVQIDVGFGDIITPESVEVTLPPVLDGLEPATMPAYTLVTVVAEKLEATVSIGAANSRVKDFYDLWVFSRRFEFQGELLTTAIGNTFQRRKTQFPTEIPIALTEEFSKSESARKYWLGFLSTTGLGEGVPPFPQIVKDIAEFVLPPLRAASEARVLDKHWHPGGPWKSD